ncbi:carbohydrate-binding module family 14 protein [Dothistroma septosporum NZE10]|uniref:Carbohydrate-binding module family 14 protein n=1 Tax=Dothistroma septosporum (strain NZE10 / CBS 128990) TaxID=675120 RepID=N1PIZ7_DOTSN|nr:carbohydrate-binding module family 14 protein [Dothistroma septosporum NZE10]
MQYNLFLLAALLGSALAQPAKGSKAYKVPQNPKTLNTHKALPPKPQPEPPVYNPCQSTEVLATKCLGPKDCLYPNPASCGTFIQCVPQDEVGNAKPVVMPCPKGLQWNDGKKWCDYPHLSTCPAKATTKTPANKPVAKPVKRPVKKPVKKKGGKKQGSGGTAQPE